MLGLIPYIVFMIIYSNGINSHTFKNKILWNVSLINIGAVIVFPLFILLTPNNIILNYGKRLGDFFDFFLLLSALLYLKFNSISYKEIEFKIPKFNKDLYLVLVIASLFALIYPILKLNYPSLLMKQEPINTIRLLLFNLVIYCAIGPFAEELYFRKIVLEAFESKYGTIKALVASAMVFAVVHGFNYGIINLFIGGIILGFIYKKTRNLFLPFLFHALWNLPKILLVTNIHN